MVLKLLLVESLDAPDVELSADCCNFSLCISHTDPHHPLSRVANNTSTTINELANNSIAPMDCDDYLRPLPIHCRWLHHATAAPSVECKLNVNVGDIQTDRQTGNIIVLSFHCHVRRKLTRAVLSQGTRAIQRVIPSPIDYLLQVLNWLKTERSRHLQHRQSPALTKSRLNAKLHVKIIETECIVHNDSSRSSRVVDFGTNQKRVWDFLLVLNSNLGPILPNFRFVRWKPLFPYPTPIPGKNADVPLE